MSIIGIVGGDGMLGSDLVKLLGLKHKVISINRRNYFRRSKLFFDVLINANGNSKRFWASSNVYGDFEKSTVSVYDTLTKFKYKKYVYISSSDVYTNHQSSRTTQERMVSGKKLSTYGFHKYLSELIVKQHSNNYLILRCSMMLGSSLKKGPLFDIFNNIPLFISSKSRIQMITTQEVASIIMLLLEKKIRNSTYNLGGKGTVIFKDIQSMVKRKVLFSKKSERQIYEMNVSKINKQFSLKSSSVYLQDYIDSLE